VKVLVRSCKENDCGFLYNIRVNQRTFGGFREGIALLLTNKTEQKNTFAEV